jgi:hypothetical protein
LKLVNWLPEEDRPVLVAAMRLQCDALITGDQAHFGPGFQSVCWRDNSLTAIIA